MGDAKRSFENAFSYQNQDYSSVTQKLSVEISPPPSSSSMSETSFDYDYFGDSLSKHSTCSIFFWLWEVNNINVI